VKFLVVVTSTGEVPKVSAQPAGWDVADRRFTYIEADGVRFGNVVVSVA